MSNNNRELSQFASRVTVDDTSKNVSIASSTIFTGGAVIGIGSDPTGPDQLSDLSLSATGRISGTRLSASSTPPGESGIQMRAHGSGPNYGLLEEEGNLVSFLGKRQDGTTGGMGEVRVFAEGDLGASWPTSFSLGLRRFADITEVVRVRSDGKVGVGSTNPERSLSISKDNASIQIEGTNGGTGRKWTLISSDSSTELTAAGRGGNFVIYDDQSDIHRVTVTGIGGSMGIGVLAPNTRLHVNGNITCNAIKGSQNSSGFLTLGAGSASAVIDTGISVNVSNGGGTMLVLASRNTDFGTNTQSGLYLLQFYYNGNNTPTKTLISGTDIMTIGQTVGNNLTVTCTVGNWSVSAFFGGYGIGDQLQGG